MKKILLLLILVLLANQVNAYNVDNINTEIEVYDDGVVKVINTYIFDSTDVVEIIIPAYSPESIIVTDDSNELKFAAVDNSIVIKPEGHTKDYQITLQYLTDQLTSKKNGDWKLIYNFPAYKNLKIDKIKESALLISLPETAKLIDFTEEGLVFTEKNSLKIGWKPKLNEYQDTNIEIEYSYTYLDRKKDYIRFAFFILIGLIILLILLICGKKCYRKIRKIISKEKKDILKTLEKREQEVIKLLLENKNKMYQSQIQKQTGISKATLSRIIKRLENRNILEVRPGGNTNLIMLQDWFLKK